MRRACIALVAGVALVAAGCDERSTVVGHHPERVIVVDGDGSADYRQVFEACYTFGGAHKLIEYDAHGGDKGIYVECNQ